MSVKITTQSIALGATASVIDFLRSRAPDARLLYISSAAVFGSDWEGPIPVSGSPAPISEYGLHKRVCEELVLGASKMHNLEISIVRFFSLYGPGLTKQILWDVVRRLEAGEDPLRMSGTGRETRDFLYIEDAARLLIQLANSAEVPKMVNGATGQACSIAEIVELVVEAVGRARKFEFSGEVRAGDPHHLVADVSCLRGFGFGPATSLEEGISAYVNWARLELASEGGEGGMSWR